MEFLLFLRSIFYDNKLFLAARNLLQWYQPMILKNKPLHQFDFRQVDFVGNWDSTLSIGPSPTEWIHVVLCEIGRSDTHWV